MVVVEAVEEDGVPCIDRLGRAQGRGRAQLRVDERGDTERERGRAGGLDVCATVGMDTRGGGASVGTRLDGDDPQGQPMGRASNRGGRTWKWFNQGLSWVSAAVVAAGCT